ncbi:MAG: T9SS C-terminal target domain-containing protein, partial [Ignavibacteriales bacterium]|nr:T9SS C-terminal target domain-containing protein [Ignavibacteriales bacterium]
MKKLLTIMLLFSAMVFAQLTPVDSTLSGHISADRVLSASKKYLISGFVYVDSTYKLTIPAGTVLFGEKSTKGCLIVKRGAKIIAQGTATKPIVFTSQQPAGLRQSGDWGGIIICGSAPNNQSTNVVIEGGP